MSIRIGIYGYGNLGRGIENAIRQNPDMTLRAVFTRRDPATLKIGTDCQPAPLQMQGVFSHLSLVIPHLAQTPTFVEDS